MGVSSFSTAELTDRLPSLSEIEAASELVHRVMPPTPQIRWPLLSTRVGAEVWVKHENHTPTGAFKVRGGIVYMDELRRSGLAVQGVISATRGNHGQSVAFCAARAGLRCVIVVPHGNSREKNAAMRSLGAELREHGEDFQEAYEYAMERAAAEQLHVVRSFDLTLVRGVATYALEMFRAVDGLDALYVPIGQGSGICGAIAVRDALGLRTEVIGVVAENAPAYARSWAAGRPVDAVVESTVADGMACRVADPASLRFILRGAARIVTVSELEIRAAMRAYFSDTHNSAEGAGAAGLAALLHERERMRGKRVGAVLSGGNVDTDVFAGVLGGT